MGQSTVLIVEDEPNVQEILTWRLGEEGYRCLAASSALQALKILEKDARVDLVLSDIRMPAMNGLELLRRIRHLDPDIAVIMLTGVSEVSTAIETLKNGAFDFITKPFNLDEVCIAAERALEKRSLILKNREYRQFLEERVEEQTREIHTLYLDAVQSLVTALEAKDSYTEGHSRRVTRYAVEIAALMGVSEELQHKIYMAGLLHDIGKIGIRESILNKPSKLTCEEFQQVYEHPIISARILSPILKERDILQFVRHHHERWNGNGLPGGLAGEDIPLGSRILAVADTFDAITSDRPYREALPVSWAVEEIQRFTGIQFDPSVVRAFLLFKDHYFKDVTFVRPVVGDIFPDLLPDGDGIDSSPDFKTLLTNLPDMMNR